MPSCLHGLTTLQTNTLVPLTVRHYVIASVPIFVGVVVQVGRHLGYTQPNAVCRLNNLAIFGWIMSPLRPYKIYVRASGERPNVPADHVVHGFLFVLQ